MLTEFQIGLMGFPVLLVLIFLRVPLAASLMIVGLVGTYMIEGNARMVNNQLKSFAYGQFTNYSLSIIPLFLLMSEFATRGGMSRDLFRAARAWLGHRKGGLAMASVGASAGFGAVCGSSLATASSMGKVALPELQRAGYSGALSTGALAAGGTLGILIPPSVVLVVYSILAEQNIEKLFLAAFIPGLIATLGYMVTIAIYVRLAPGSASQETRLSYRDRVKVSRPVIPVLVIFAVVIGGIYSGAFSPTAAAAVGVAGTALVALRQGSLGLSDISDSLLATAMTSGMIFFIIVGALIFNSFLSAAGVPQSMAEYFETTSLNPWLILTGMLLLYLILGTVMDSLAMIFLTVPIYIDIVLGLDFGLTPDEIGIWFGILVLMAAEIGLITPPVGLNLFVINAMSKDVPIGQTYRGILPFVASDIIRIGILVAFPILSLWLVRLVG